MTEQNLPSHLSPQTFFIIWGKIPDSQREQYAALVEAIEKAINSSIGSENAVIEQFPTTDDAIHGANTSISECTFIFLTCRPQSALQINGDYGGIKTTVLKLDLPVRKRIDIVYGSASLKHVDLETILSTLTLAA